MTIAERLERRLERLYRRLGPRHLAAARLFSVALLGVSIAAMLPVYLAYIPESTGKGLRAFVVIEAIVIGSGWFGAARSWARASAPVDHWLAGNSSKEETFAAWLCIRSLPRELVRRAMAWGVGGMLLPALAYGAIEFEASVVDVASAALAGLATGFWVSMMFVPAYELYLRPVRLELARRVARDHHVEPQVRTRLGAKLLIAVPLISLLTSFAVAIVATAPGNGWRQLAILALVAILATVTLSAGMVVLLTRALVTPIEELLDTTRRVDDGDLSSRAAVTTDDEIGEIGLSFNDMLDTIAQLSTANRQLLDEVRSSRSRIITASDAERVRIERNIHDGAQQRLVTLALKIRMLRDDPGVPAAAEERLRACSGELDVAMSELRDLARGLHPSVLTTDGLLGAIEQLAARFGFSVDIDVPARRWAGGVEATGWFVISEALANAARYARASAARVRVQQVDGNLVVEVSDDGVGGASIGIGSGLVGLVDRVEAVGGRLAIDSPAGQGTIVTAEIPLAIGAIA